jgi:ankyrin repeat protein
MHAARQGALEAGEAIAGSPQIDLNVVDPDGTTALVVAIINAHYDFASMLLDKGADPNVADSTGRRRSTSSSTCTRLAECRDVRRLSWWTRLTPKRCSRS